jgi:DNA-binding NtrC family response regulator
MPRLPSTSGRKMISLAPEVKEGGACILVVDDDEGVRENLAELFEVVGYTVLTAGNAAEAMETLAEHDVDILLTDYRMPGQNGVELIEAARRTKPGLRAILMTAFGDSFTEIESVRRGAIGYLNKPFEADEITNLVARLLALKGE